MAMKRSIGHHFSFFRQTAELGCSSRRCSPFIERDDGLDDAGNGATGDEARRHQHSRREFGLGRSGRWPRLQSTSRAHESTGRCRRRLRSADRGRRRRGGGDADQLHDDGDEHSHQHQAPGMRRSSVPSMIRAKSCAFGASTSSSHAPHS